MNDWKLGLLMTGAFFSLACSEDVDSEAIRTEGMYAHYEALAVGDGSTELSCSLRVGGNNGTFVELTGDDQLTAITAEETRVLSKRSNGNRHFYETELDSDAGGLVIQVSFTRGDMDDDAAESFVSLPEPFVPTLAEDMPREVQRGGDVMITWDNEGPGEMEWSLNGDCVFLDTGSTSDDGTLTIAEDDIKVTGTDEGESCEVEVTLERINRGSTDPNFEEGGRFVATQQRVVTFTSTPAPEELESGAGGSGP